VSAARSPHIDSVSWGQVRVGERTFKDAKLFPGGAREWDWRETGTSHRPGIQPTDVEELLDHGARVVVLSRGFLRALQVMPETLELLRERGVEVLLLTTGEAVERYNQLLERSPGALVHSTC
jgi:hypothetical protein